VVPERGRGGRTVVSPLFVGTHGPFSLLFFLSFLLSLASFHPTGLVLTSEGKRVLTTACVCRVSGILTVTILSSLSIECGFVCASCLFFVVYHDGVLPT